MPKLNLDHWIEKLGLQPHPEGGYFKETYRTKSTVCLQNKNKEYNIGTDIYFLLGSPSIGHFSAWHRLNGIDETWHYNYGDDLTVYWIDENEKLVESILGIGKNAQLQIHIPANCWFAAVVNNPNPEAYALVSCICFPGFDFSDFVLADRNKLIKKYPKHEEIISQLTRISCAKKKHL